MVVEFEGENFKTRGFNYKIEPNENKGIIGILIKTGLVKNSITAKIVLGAVCITSLLVTGLILYFIFIKEEQVEYALPEDVIKTLPAEIQEKIYESRK